MEILTPQYNDDPVNSKLSRLLCSTPCQELIGYERKLQIDSVWSVLPKIEVPSIPAPRPPLNWHGWQAFMNMIRANFAPTIVTVDFELEGVVRRKTDLETLKTYWYWESKDRLPLDYTDNVIYDLELILPPLEDSQVELHSGGQLLERSVQGPKYEFMHYGLPFEMYPTDLHSLCLNVKAVREDTQPIKAQISYKTVKISDQQKQALCSTVEIQTEPLLCVWWDFRIAYHLQMRGQFTCCGKSFDHCPRRDWTPHSIQCDDPNCGKPVVNNEALLPEPEEPDFDSAMLTADELASVLRLV